MSESQFVVYGLCLDVADVRQVRYVGLTRNGAFARVRGHLAAAYRDGTYPVHCWIRKYGRDRIQSVILEYVDVVDDLPERERYWIQKLETHVSLKRGGLNCTWGGEFGNVWDSFTDEQKDAVRERMRRIQMLLSSDPKLAEERSARSRRIMLEVNSRPEVVQKKSDRMRAMHQDPEFAAATSRRASVRMQALHKDQAFAAQRDQRSRDRWNDPQYREMMTKNAVDIARRTAHTRWHTNRGIVNPSCELCASGRT